MIINSAILCRGTPTCLFCQNTNSTHFSFYYIFNFLSLIENTIFYFLRNLFSTVFSFKIFESFIASQFHHSFHFSVEFLYQCSRWPASAKQHLILWPAFWCKLKKNIILLKFVSIFRLFPFFSPLVWNTLKSMLRLAFKCWPKCWSKYTTIRYQAISEARISIILKVKLLLNNHYYKTFSVIQIYK